jgi:hypothetical protein
MAASVGSTKALKVASYSYVWARRRKVLLSRAASWSLCSSGRALGRREGDASSSGTSSVSSLPCGDSILLSGTSAAEAVRGSSAMLEEKMTVARSSQMENQNVTEVTTFLGSDDLRENNSNNTMNNDPETFYSPRFPTEQNVNPESMLKNFPHMHEGKRHRNASSRFFVNAQIPKIDK